MPRPEKKMGDKESLLHAALEWYELQKSNIDTQISEIRAMLGTGEKRRGRTPESKAAAKKSAAAAHRTHRKPMSAAAKRRIAAAQKRRWAEYRKKASAGSAA